MSSEADGSGRTDDIVIIKQLLQKLEEAAARDAETPQAEPAREEPPLLVLRSNRGTLAANPMQAADGEAASSKGMPEFSRPLISIDVPTGDKALADNSALATGPHEGQAARRGPGMTMAVLSFVLGIIAAGGLIVAFDPFGQRRGGATVARAPSVVAPSTAEKSSADSARDGGEAQNGRQAAAAADAAASSTTPDFSAAPDTTARPEPARQDTASAQVPAVAEVPATASASSGDKIALRVAPRIELKAGERRPIEVHVNAPPSEAQRLLVVFHQVPAWMTFSKGGAIGNDIWLLPAQMVRDLEVEVNEGADGVADVKIQLAKVDGSILSETSVSFIAAPPVLPPVTAGVGSGGNEATILRLQARGELLLDTGEVEAARTLLRTAAEAGSVAAALRLAETYDPAESQRLGMAERSADLGLAVRWYEHAHALGSPVATARLVALGRR